jgi:hypothetical protein
VRRGQGSFQHAGDDFHIAMRVGRESGARDDSVFVDDFQMTEAHVLWIIVVAERERTASSQLDRVRPLSLPRLTMIMLPPCQFTRIKW